jgi:hypothetical protein
MTKHPRIFAIVAGLAIALAASTSVWATGAKPPALQPTPSPAAQAWADAQAQAAADAQATGGAGGAGGAGGSVGDVNNTAVGGAGGTGVGGSGTGGSSRATAGPSTSYSASEAGDVSNMIGGSKYLSLPQPVWTSVPTPYGCLVTESKAGAVGWNFVSASGSKQYSDAVCTTIRMAEAAYLHCQYLTAAYLNKRAFETMHPGEDGGFFLAASPENLNPVQCDDLKRPRLVMAPSIEKPVADTPPATVQSVPVTVNCPAPAVQTRTIYRDKPKAPVCVTK